MKSALGVALGIALLGAAVRPSAGQAVRVEVGIHVPPVAARVVLGRGAYLGHAYPRGGAWVTNPRLARLHRQHMAWLAREHARLDALRRHDYRRHRQAVRAFERQRLLRERALEREYERWLRERERGGRHGHRR